MTILYVELPKHKVYFPHRFLKVRVEMAWGFVCLITKDFFSQVRKNIENLLLDKFTLTYIQQENNN